MTVNLRTEILQKAAVSETLWQIQRPAFYLIILILTVFISKAIFVIMS